MITNGLDFRPSQFASNFNQSVKNVGFCADFPDFSGVTAKMARGLRYLFPVRLTSPQSWKGKT